MRLFSRKSPEEKRLDELKEIEKGVSEITRGAYKSKPNKPYPNFHYFYMCCAEMEEYERLTIYFNEFITETYVDISDNTLDLDAFLEQIKAGVYSMLVTHKFKECSESCSVLINNHVGGAKSVSEDNESYNHIINNIKYIQGLCYYQIGQYTDAYESLKNIDDTIIIENYGKTDATCRINLLTDPLNKSSIDYKQLAKSKIDLIHGLENNISHYTEGELYELVQREASDEIRLPAINGINDEKLLAKIYNSESDDEIKYIIAQKITNPEILNKMLHNTTDFKTIEYILNSLNENNLKNIAHTFSNPLVQIEAIKHVNDEETLYDIALNSKTQNISVEAVKKIEDIDRLESIIDNSSHREVVIEAMSRIPGQSQLWELIDNTQDFELKCFAITKLKNSSKLMNLFDQKENPHIKRAAFIALKNSGEVSYVIRNYTDDYLVEKFLREMDRFEIKEILKKGVIPKGSFKIEYAYWKRVFIYYFEEKAKGRDAKQLRQELIDENSKCMSCGGENLKIRYNHNSLFLCDFIDLECKECGRKFSAPSLFVKHLPDDHIKIIEDGIILNHYDF